MRAVRYLSRWILFVCATLLLLQVGLTRAHRSLAADPPDPPISISPLVQDHIEWVVALVNGAREFDEVEYQERFSPVFIEQVPANLFKTQLEGFQALGESWSVTGIESSTSQRAVVRISPASGEPVFLMAIAVDAAGGTIVMLQIQTGEFPTLEDPPATIGDATDRLLDMGYNLSFLVADVEGDEPACAFLDGLNEDVPTPLGSMFKLYVLGAVVDAINNGTLAWNQSVEILDRYKSLPSGIVQFDPPGTMKTVRKLAELMISISDNTATDHLMGLVGRRAVEVALRDYGHSAVHLNEPFLFTREFFYLKLSGKTNANSTMPGKVGQMYLATAEIEERRGLLSLMENVSMKDLDLMIWTRPIAVDGIEWFGTPLDLCNVLARLHLNEEAARILKINPGIPDEKGLWSYVGFKGGSEPGVLGMAWYVEGEGGIRRVVTGTVWDTDRAIGNGIESTLLLSAMRDLSVSITSSSTTAPPSGTSTTSMTTPNSNSNSGNDTESLTETPEQRSSSAMLETAPIVGLSIILFHLHYILCFSE